MKLANGFGWALAAAAMVAAPGAEGAFQVKQLYHVDDRASDRANHFDVELAVYSEVAKTPDAQGSCLTYVVEGNGIDCTDNLDEGGNHRTLDGVYDVEQANHPMVVFDDRGWATVKAKLGEKDVIRVTGVFGPYDLTYVSSAPNGKDQRMTCSTDGLLRGMTFYVIERDPGIYEPTGYVYTGDDATADPNVSTTGMTETQKLSASRPDPTVPMDENPPGLPAGALLVQGEATGSSQTVFVVNMIDYTKLSDAWGQLQVQFFAGGDITLTNDVVCDDQKIGRLHVRGGVAVSLDLNGHTLDRAMTNDTDHDMEDGGVFVVRSNGSLAISDSKGGGTITGGKTSGDGGGVLVESGGSFTMTGGTFAGNVAGGRGGAIHSEGALRVTGSAFVGNGANQGGAIHTEGTNVVINHNAFIGNHDSNGTTIVCDDPPPPGGANDSNASLEHVGFADNNWFGNFESDFAATPDVSISSSDPRFHNWWFLRIEREIDGATGQYRLKAVPCLYSSTSEHVLEVPDPADYRLPPITLNCFATNAAFDGATATNPATIRLSREGHASAAFEPQIAEGGYAYTVGVVVPGYASLSESLTFEHSGAADDDETTSVRIVKVWDDGSDRAGRRPSSVSFTLAGGSFETNVVLDCSGGADRVETTVSGVPRYAGGSEIAYSLVEDPVPGDYRAVVVDEGKVVPETAVEPGVSLSLTVNGAQNARVGEGETLNFLAMLSGAEPVGTVNWSWNCGGDTITKQTDVDENGNSTLSYTYDEIKVLATAGEEYVMTATYRTNGVEAARARVPFGLLGENPAVVFVEPALDATFYVDEEIGFKVRGYKGRDSTILTFKWQCASSQLSTGYSAPANGTTETMLAFREAGDHRVTVTVTDQDSKTGSETIVVHVVEPPEPIQSFSVTNSYAPPPVVSNVVARQRWPWNGLVDVDYEVGGDTNLLAGLTARISFAASDGRSWVATNFLAGAEPSAAPGAHRATWDTAADGATNVVAAEVVATVALVRPPRWCVVDLSGGTNAASYPVAYFVEPPAGGWNADAYMTTNLVLRLVKPSDWADGTFTMGGSCAVALTNAFWIGVFEMTQRQWELVAGGRPSFFRRDECYATRPVEKVSYAMIRGSDAGSQWPDSGDVDEDSFLGRLRARTGLAFDLPTEAQWEFACRATTTADYNNGTVWTGGTSCTNLDQLGRYWFNGGGNGNGNPDCDTGKGTSAAGGYLPNEWGLYDFHGNVWEWCLDWSGDLADGAVEPAGAPSGEKRVLRGGCWSDNAVNCRSTGRIGMTPDFVGNFYGFRLCLPAGPETAP